MRTRARFHTDRVPSSVVLNKLSSNLRDHRAMTTLTVQGPNLLQVHEVNWSGKLEPSWDVILDSMSRTLVSMNLLRHTLSGEMKDHWLTALLNRYTETLSHLGEAY